MTMKPTNDLAFLLLAIQGYLDAHPEAFGMMVHPGSATFAGHQVEPPSGSVIVAGPSVRTMPELIIFGEYLQRGLVAGTGFAPGPQAAVLVAYRHGEGVRSLLVRSWVDASDAFPDRHSVRHAANLAGNPAAAGVRITVDGKERRARIGEVVGSVHEIRRDGSLLFIERLASGRAPAPGVLLNDPVSVQAHAPSLRIPHWVVIAPPNDADLAAWSDGHYGSLDVAENMSTAIFGS